MAGGKPDISLGEMKTEVVLPQGNSVAELSPGMEVGQCRVIKLLGSGGMGQVYLVENIQMHKKYAMKILPQELSKDPTFIDRFRIEARVMADLDHPNIVHVQYIGEDTGRYFILMDYVEGPDGEPQTLDDRLKSEGKLQENDIVEILRQLCEALEYAHNFCDGGVIHRDLKPSNILLDKTGKPLVADFGLAKVTGDEYLKSMIEHSIRLTMSGNSSRYSPDVSIGDMKTVVEGKGASTSSKQGTAGALIGTYEYMAPEQQDGKDASIQSDIYSLGMILYYCLTGKKPRGRWKLPSKIGLSPVWDSIIEKALEPEPEDRYGSTMDLYRHLHEVHEQHIADEASKTSSGKQESPAPKKTGNKSLFKKLALLILLIVFISFGAWYVLSIFSNSHKVVTTPAVTKPAVTKPAVTKPAVTKPAVTKPAVTIPTIIKDKIIPGLDIKLVYVKPGSFMMGYNDEVKSKPIHKVKIDNAYWIGKYEITQNEYQKIMGTNPSHFNNGDKKPVEQVSWDDAQAFCTKLTEQEKKAGRLPSGYEYRLPTESEWEYAARGGAKSQGYIYSGSGNINSVAWHTYNSGKQTQDVGQKMPNELGIHDMSGNVWEWCLDDWFSNYNNAPADGSYQIKKTSISHANRGGSCRNNAKSTHVAHRNESATFRKVSNLGFRVALAPVIVKKKIAVTNPLDKTIPELGLKLVHVEPGSFMMGSNDEESSKPLRKVKIAKAYWIGKYEITQQEYQSIMGTNPSRYKKERRPVEQVSWNDAIKFCQKLTEQEKKAKRLPTGYEFRLPTEAEWEYAARGGNKSKGYTYSGGNDVRAVAWNKYTAKKRPHEVGGKPGNELGIHDMSGNVYEWCLDNWHENYNNAPLDASAWLNVSNTFRVYRGGGLRSPSRWCTVAHRSRNSSDKKFDRLGFRIVLAPIVKTIHAKFPDKIIPDLGMKLIYIAPGVFEMGSNRKKSCKPVHKVSIHKAYWIGKYEITQSEYQKIMGTNPSHFKGANKPVEKVSWHDAVNFCKKLTERERKAGRLPPGYTYQLPTEAEWEYAARGGNKSKGYEYSGGKNLLEVAWTSKNSENQTHEVGKKAANELGIHDICGNVYEWCMDDWHPNYNKAPSAANCWGENNTPLRVRRGGGWRRNFIHRTTDRSYCPPSRKYNYLGFRVALRTYHQKAKIPVKVIVPQAAKTEKAYKQVSEKEHQENIINEKRKARKRMYADMKKYSKKEYDEIQSLYQAMYKLKDPEKTQQLKKLISKYPKANRTGCALLYLAYYERGSAQRTAYLKVIKKHSDCYYGDGTNVGADAKYFLARYYLSHKQMDKLKSVFYDLRENYPAAIHHNSKNIVSLVQEML